MQTVFVVIYNGVGFFPPTINAIDILSENYKKVIVIELMNHKLASTEFNENVKVYQVLHNPTSYLNRALSYYRFNSLLYKLVRCEKPQLIIFYDASSAISVYASTIGLNRKPILWYHNHDTMNKKYLRRFSLGYFALWLENKIIERIEIFSLPADERKNYFKIDKFKGKYALIPNYPSKKLFETISNKIEVENTISIIYQGMISPGHGIEEIIEILDIPVNNKKLKLVLVGLINPEYKKQLELLIEKNNSTSAVEFQCFKAYKMLFGYTSKHQIGLAIYTGTDQMNSTIGTASNKIYEYTACGLPFLYFKNKHFDFHLSGMPWAIATDLTKESLLQRIEEIDNNYHKYSKLAKDNFLAQRNFENVFIPIVDYTREIIERNQA